MASNNFFADDYSIADIALFAYTHVADEGGFPLNDFPHVLGWIERITEQANFVPMSS